MANGPTIVNSGGGGAGAIATLVVIAGVVLLFFTGAIDLTGVGGKPEFNIETPAAPAAPKAPAPAQ